MFDELIQVEVGQGAESKIFTVHKGVASFYSGYLQAATKKCYKEGQTGVIKLPTENIAIFGRFVRWLYTRQIDVPEADFPAFRGTAELWAFADRREIPLLANTMINTMRDIIVRTWTVPTLHLTFIYENTTSTAELRRFVVEEIVYTGGVETLMSDDSKRVNWPPEALWDVLKLVWGMESSKKMTNEKLADMDVCAYHRHEEGVRCPKA